MNNAITYQTSEYWRPLDQRWISECRMGSRRYAAYGPTPEEAEAALGRKLEKLAAARHAETRDGTS